MCLKLKFIYNKELAHEKQFIVYPVHIMQNFSIIHVSTVTETEKRKLGVCVGGMEFQSMT